MVSKPPRQQKQMNNLGKSNQYPKGIIHCHTDLSYDGLVSLADLCSSLQATGFSFVAITEHVKGLTSEQYSDFVTYCKAISTSSFVAIPGLEVRLDDGFEIAAVGISHFIDTTSKEEVIEAIRNQGGYSIWVHPYKRGRPDLSSIDCDAIEILNGKIDGTVHLI